MAAQKDVKIKLATEADLKEIEALENKINEIKRQKLQLNIEANTSKLQETEKRIQGLKIFLDNVNHGNTPIHIDDSEIKKAEQELDALESDKINIQLAIETDKLNAAKSELDSLDNTTIDVDVNNISAMESIDQIGQGFDRLKTGATEVGQQLGDVLESAGRMEQTETFLTMNLGTDQAQSKLAEIRSVTDALPGDDVVLQNLLSQAAIKDLSLAKDDFQQMGNAAADYMAAMQNYGKSATETQQDLMNYILTGNTAEIELSPILASHVDQLKEGTTVKERSLLLQQALNEEHWGGIASQDTYNNKFQQFNDMIERGKMNLGGMFLDASKGAMDWLMQLDNANSGIVGLTLAMASFASPVADAVMGIGQIGMGLKGLADANDLLGITDKLSKLKTVVLDTASAFKDLAVKVLTAGYNALKSAAMWVYQKLALVASTVAEYALAAAQAVLNFVMSVNPIVLVVLALIALAAAFLWAYNNVDWFREMVDNAWASVQQFAAGLWSSLTGALQWLGSLFQQFTSQLGINTSTWQDAIISFITFIPLLPLRIGVALVNAIAKVLGFGDNFCQSLLNTAATSVSNFMSHISTLPGKLWNELQNMLSKVGEWAATLPQKFWDAGVNAVKNFLSALGIASPGTMQRMMVWEVSEMGRRVPLEGRKLLSNVGKLGEDVVSEFGSPSIGLSFDETANASIMANSNDQLAGQVNNFYFSDIVVDNDDRMQKIVEYVTRELAWNNRTAGRTI